MNWGMMGYRLIKSNINFRHIVFCICVFTNYERNEIRKTLKISENALSEIIKFRISLIS